MPKKIPAAHAGYMELEGAKKDGDCAIVRVSGGISSKKGCCDLYDPQKGADEFRCGECIYVRINGAELDIPLDQAFKRS